MFTRFNGNVVPFADDSTSTNRTVFGGVTQSDAIDDNLNADFKKGWEIVGLNDNPTREDFNAMGYTLGALISYLYQMGISEWNTSQNYRVNSRVIGSNGKLYKALTGTIGSPNVGKNPTSDAVNWQLEIITDYSTLTAKTTPIDADLIALGDSTSSFSLKKLTWANIKATLKTYFDTLYVALSGNQTIADIKTFTSSPIVPTPTTDMQAANKAYVDESLLNPTLTANATLTGTDNKIVMNGIVTSLGLEIGDVIQFRSVANANNQKMRTVESIINNNEIIVNYEHCGSRGNGTLKLTDETLTNATIKRIAKWYNAPVGLGQAWVNTTATRVLNTQYASPPNRSFGLYITTDTPTSSYTYKLTVDGVVAVTYTDDQEGGLHFAVINVSNNYKYESGSITRLMWQELR